MSTLGIVAARSACGPSRQMSMVRVGPEWTSQVRKWVPGRTTKGSLRALGTATDVA
jgi:hypothetical protein